MKNNEQILSMKDIVKILTESNVNWEIEKDNKKSGELITIYNVEFKNVKDKEVAAVDISIDKNGVVDLQDYIMLAAELLILKREQEEGLV